MTVAALLDLGADEKVLLETLKTLPLEGAEVKISRVIKSGLDACDFDVILDAEHENHDHDMAYLHPDRAELHSHDHGHDHGHDHTHDLTPVEFDGEILYPEPIKADDILIDILAKMVEGK
jgi:uncharacterized protein (DUF111 family)